MPEQFVNAESHGYGDSHQAFVFVYPGKFPSILEIMESSYTIYSKATNILTLRRIFDLSRGLPRDK